MDRSSSARRMPLQSQRRFSVGVWLGARCRRISAAVVAAEGRGLATDARLWGYRGEDVPAAISRAFVDLREGESIDLKTLGQLRLELAELAAELIGRTLDEARVAPPRVLVIGQHDPGLWQFSGHRAVGWLNLCDAARLAEVTGANVVDAFPLRDLAGGGQGGPLGALPEWLLLSDPDQEQLIVHLGRTVRMTYLPKRVASSADLGLASFLVGPGTALLDALSGRLTAGRERFDAGGRLAVQGRRIEPLMEHWLADPYFERPPPRWHPAGVKVERFLADALRMAVENDWSVRDLLCTATHFVAETVALAARRCLPRDAAPQRTIYLGGGKQNGLLLSEIIRRTGLPRLPLVEALGADWEDDRAVQPATAALLALLYIDRVPASTASLTNVDSPRVLGRLTAGSPQQWQRLIEAFAISI